MSNFCAFLSSEAKQISKQIKCGQQNVASLQQVLFVCCLFSCRYNPLWLYFHSPVAGFSLLVFRGFLITHDAPQSVGLLWTSDQSVAGTST
jgi:hypothetical protein